MGSSKDIARALKAYRRDQQLRLFAAKADPGQGELFEPHYLQHEGRIERRAALLSPEPTPSLPMGEHTPDWKNRRSILRELGEQEARAEETEWLLLRATALSTYREAASTAAAALRESSRLRAELERFAPSDAELSQAEQIVRRIAYQDGRASAQLDAARARLEGPPPRPAAEVLRELIEADRELSRLGGPILFMKSRSEADAALAAVETQAERVAKLAAELERRNPDVEELRSGIAYAQHAEWELGVWRARVAGLHPARKARRR